jgi:alcohol dehydrogenase
VLNPNLGDAPPLQPFDLQLRTRVVFGEGTLDRLGTLAAELNFKRTLLVADPGLAATAHVSRAAQSLEHAGVSVSFFHEFDANPNGVMVEAGRRVAARADSIVALGGGSSLDCAKGINFLLAGGGSIRDYRGYGKVRGTMRPAIGIPTTAGTGSEAQSYAILSDAETHEKMACGDPQAAFRIAILDPALTVTAPRGVTAVAGFDALSHAVESFVTAKRSAASIAFAREAWRLLEPHFERVLDSPEDRVARGAMLLGSHFAGVAIEQSMLGAAHACANPLTARYNISHGLALAMLLPHVVRWNASVASERYAALLGSPRRSARDADAAESLAVRLEDLAAAGGLAMTLRESGVEPGHLPDLAALAAQQWTGTFNPRPFDAAGALEIYRAAA